jgi:hypothetical protein
MFKKLFDLNYQRNIPEAIIFYISYVAFFSLIFFLFGFFATALALFYGYQMEYASFIAQLWGWLLEIFLCIFFVVIFFTYKKISKKWIVFFMATILSVLGLFFGFYIMLIPLTYLTTTPSEAIEETGKSAKKKVLKFLLIGLLIIVVFFFLLRASLYIDHFFSRIIYIDHLINKSF